MNIEKNHWSAGRSRLPLRLGRMCIVALAALGAGRPAEAQTSPLEVELEGGAVWLGRNDVEIPNDGTASRFSLSALTGSGPWPVARVYVTWSLAERHALRLLAAPLTVRESGAPSMPIDFAGARFLAGTAVEAAYTFNSYRLTYRWRFHSSASTTAWLGLTAKVRDASVVLAQGSVQGRKDDLGFVPLVHMAGSWQAGSRWALSLDVDALAGGPGRAVDGSAKVGYQVSDRWAIRVGYRTVEGGADVESVYNFAWVHYAVAAVTWRW